MLTLDWLWGCPQTLIQRRHISSVHVGLANGCLLQTGGTYNQSCMCPTNSAGLAFLISDFFKPVSVHLCQGLTVPPTKVCLLCATPAGTYRVQSTEFPKVIYCKKEFGKLSFDYGRSISRHHVIFHPSVFFPPTQTPSPVFSQPFPVLSMCHRCLHFHCAFDILSWGEKKEESFSPSNSNVTNPHCGEGSYMTERTDKISTVRTRPIQVAVVFQLPLSHVRIN